MVPYEVIGGTFWATTGTGNWQVRDNLNSPIGGQNTIIGIESDGATTRQLGQDTGHVLALGDQFSGSFGWRDAWNWGAGETIDMFLFYTADDTLGGTRSVLTTLNSGDETAGSTHEVTDLTLNAVLTPGNYTVLPGNKVTVASLEGVTASVTLGSVTNTFASFAILRPKAGCRIIFFTPTRCAHST